MKNHRPPSWANSFLEWYCRADRLEEIQGDVHELFGRTVSKSPGLARLQFVWNVFRFFRLDNIRKYHRYHNNNAFTMFYSYLVIGFRNALRNGVTSLVNVGGLAIGVAGAITIFIFADQWFHTDDFHVNRDRIYEVTNVVNRDSTMVTLSDTPLLLGPMLLEDASGIQRMTRIEIGSGALRFGDLVFSERLWFTDPAFFEIFTFSHVGVPQDALKAPNSIVLTKPVAEKYFNDHDPVGKTVTMKFPNNTTREFVVTAVADLPANNTLHFNVLLSMDVFQNLKLNDVYDWTYLTDATFVLMKPGQSIETLQPLMDKYKKLQNESSPDWPIESFKFYDLDEISSGSAVIESYTMGSGQPQGIITMLVIAFLLLLLACFNYTNISVATISTRLKEIGIRKVVGGRQGEIVQQFIAENVLMCAFAMGFGLTIAYLFFMPGIVALVGYPIPFAFSSGTMMLTFFSGLLTFTVAISGVYPAFYVSGFHPVLILKGKEKFGQRSAFSRVLLTMQFILAFMTIIGCFLFIDNGLYMRNKDWGYDHHQNVVVPVNSQEQYLKLRDVVAARTDIAQYAGAVNHIGSNAHRDIINYASSKFEMIHFGVGHNYLEAMNLRLKRGRLFDRAMASDSVGAVVVNETFVRSMNWENGLNENFMYDGRQRTVIGVVTNFHHDDFYMGIRPALFTLAPERDFRYLAMKVQGDTKQVEGDMRNLWKEIGPDDPYRGILQDDVFSNYNKNSRNDMSIIISVAVITLLLACLGLFGLVSYNITRRLKEFSVRKVFGANALQIFRLMNRDYAWILTIAFLIGAPAGYLLMDQLINTIYPDPQPATIVPFATAITMMVLTVALTIASQMSRVLRENPVQTLRSE